MSPFVRRGDSVRQLRAASGGVKERFSVRISTAQEREAALPRVYQAALKCRIALIAALPRGRDRSGQLCTASRSVIVANIDTEWDWVNRIMKQGADRLIGFYQIAGSKHRELLEAIEEDIQEAARGMEDAHAGV